MPAAIVMPGLFMPIGITCAPHLLPYRRVYAGRHSLYAGHHRILWVRARPPFVQVTKTAKPATPSPDKQQAKFLSFFAQQNTELQTRLADLQATVAVALLTSMRSLLVRMHTC